MMNCLLPWLQKGSCLLESGWIQEPLFLTAVSDPKCSVEMSRTGAAGSHQEQVNASPSLAHSQIALAEPLIFSRARRLCRPRHAMGANKTSLNASSSSSQAAQGDGAYALVLLNERFFIKAAKQVGKNG